MTVVTTYQNVLTKEEWDTVFSSYLIRPAWMFGHSSTGKERCTISPPPRYWIMDLTEEDYFTQYLSEKILDLVPVKGLKLKDVYAGGNTFGTSGDIHSDSDIDGRYTFLYHASPDLWKPMYGGKTNFYPDNAPAEYYEFTPNGGLFFDSTIRHVGEPVTRYFGGLRICIAFKLIPNV